MQTQELKLPKLVEETVLEARNVDIFYGNYKAVAGVNLSIPKNKVTAFIGPSGCGKSTILRCFNRLNDLITSFKVEKVRFLKIVSTDCLFFEPFLVSSSL